MYKMAKLTSLEQALIDVGKKYYKDSLILQAIDSETGQSYLLTQGKSHNEPYTYHFTLYKKKEKGFDVVEAYKIIDGQISPK